MCRVVLEEGTIAEHAAFQSSACVRPCQSVFVRDRKDIKDAKDTNCKSLRCGFK